MSRRRLIVIAVGLIGFGAAMAGLDVRASDGARVTGDEPQYLISAISLWEDGNLDVSDEIDGDRYRAWHEIPLDPQTRPLTGGREVSPHDPLLSAVLAIPMAIGGWVAAKTALAIIAGGLASVTAWTAAVRFGVPLSWAAVTTGIFAASAPFAVYGTQVYPEIAAAFVVAAFIALVTGRLGPLAIAVSIVCVIALPWLSVKYVPVAAVIAAALLIRLQRDERRPAALMVLATLVAAGVAYIGAHWAWYGGWTVYATGDHFIADEFGVIGRAPNYIGRSARLMGLLVDRTFGLAAWQPAWLLAIPAAAAMVRSRVPHVGLLLAVGIAGWLSATFVALTMHGWWWPGRQVVVILPVAVLAIAWWVGRNGIARVALIVAGAWGVLTYAWTVVEGLGGRITWVVDFASTRNPLFRSWRVVLPDYMSATGTTWMLHACWIAAAAALAWWGWKSAPRINR